MIIVFALGNPGKEYENTRHNAGQVILNTFLHNQALALESHKGFMCVKHGDVYFVISTGFMNESGHALEAFLSYFKVDLNEPTNHLVVLQDDSDQLMGACKLVAGGGTAGHKGVIDIYRVLDSHNVPQQKCWRLKAGIRPEGNRLRSETFVLSGLSQIDLHILKQISEMFITQNTLRSIKASEFDTLVQIVHSFTPTIE